MDPITTMNLDTIAISMLCLMIIGNVIVALHIKYNSNKLSKKFNEISKKFDAINNEYSK